MLPMFVRMSGKKCLVVGGGPVAERKIAVLLEAGAVVTVVSPSCTERIRGWQSASKLKLEQIEDGKLSTSEAIKVNDWECSARNSEKVHSLNKAGVLSVLEREYESGDGDGALLIVAATNRPDVNKRVVDDAKARGQLVNAVQSPELGTVALPAVLRRGKLVVAVSTTGASPAAAGAIRDRIDALLGDEAERLLDFLERFRQEAKARVSDAARRSELLKQALHGDVFGLMQAGSWDAYEADMLRLLNEAVAASADADAGAGE